MVDLLAAGGPEGQQAAQAAAAGGAHPFVLVRCPTLEEAMRLLSLGRSRSINAKPTALPSAARASLFVRLALHDAVRGSLASLYLVDLVGSGALPTRSTR